MFLKAYGEWGKKESYLQYLAAVRMDLSNKEYISFIADNDDAYEASMEIEKRMNEAEQLYGASDDNHVIGTLSVIKAEGKMHEYYDRIGEMTEELKDEYRELVKDKK